jgi:hypothetical protein
MADSPERIKRDVCESCHAPVIWTITTNSDRLLVDADPATPAEGKHGVLLTWRGPQVPPLAKVTRSAHQMFGKTVYRRHLDTCPRSDLYRQRAARRAGG